jgi:aldehyde dehydrogenase (NAD+)
MIRSMSLASPIESTPSKSSSDRSASDQEIVSIVTRLRKTFESGVTRSLEWRLRELKQIERMITDNEPEILDALNADLGKSRFEGFMTETGFVLTDLRYMRKHLTKWVKPKKVKAPLPVQPASAKVYSEPLGEVLVIAPWNYPFQLAIAPLIGAVAAGNTVVIKPSEVAPATSALLAKLLPKYCDRDAIAVIEGGVPETTQLLEQRFDHIFYTGNGHVGRIVMTAAAKHLTPVTLELGGKSPCIVDRDADLAVAAKRIAWGKFVNAGQTCVAPDYLLVDESVHDKFLDKLSEAIGEFYGPDPQASGDYARIVNERHHDRLCKLMDSGDVVVGGKTDRANRYIAPTVLRGVSEDSPAMQDEIFGPILPVFSVKSLDEAIDFVNRRDKPLALYVFSKDKQVAERVLTSTSSGGVCVNDCLSHLVPPELPFGGVGPSGMGAYHGKASFDTFSHKKSVLDKPTRLDPPLRYPPYTDDKAKWVKRLL